MLNKIKCFFSGHKARKCWPIAPFGERYQYWAWDDRLERYQLEIKEPMLISHFGYSAKCECCGKVFTPDEEQLESMHKEKVDTSQFPIRYTPMPLLRPIKINWS